MRNRTMLLIGALLLASAALPQAQQQRSEDGQSAVQTTATPASSFKPQWGLFDFGYRGDSLDGDEARYNRFQDNRDGVVARFNFSRENATTFWTAQGDNIGWRDQRFYGEYNAIGKLKASFNWAQNPLFMASGSRTLYTDLGNGRLEIADNVQQSIQNATALGNPARDAAITAALANGNELDLYSRRDVGTFNVAYMFNRDVDLKLRVRQTRRNGNQLFAYGFGTSPGLSPAVELGVPIDDRTTDMRGAIASRIASILAFNAELLSSCSGVSSPDKSKSDARSNTTGIPLSIQVTVTPCTSSTAEPVGNNAPQLEPATSRNSNGIAAAVPGTPSMRASPSYSTAPFGVGT